MIDPLTIILLIIFLSYYLTFLWDVRRGLRSVTGPSNGTTPHVSVIVAARNEERTILKCLQSLNRQDYDPEKYEIVIVDDHSRDKTLEVVNHLAADNKSGKIKVCSLSHRREVQGKPAAIAVGIENSSGEIILCTDADCELPPHWISSMVGCFDPSIAFVAGPVLEHPTNSFFSCLQSLEFLGLITTAAGLIGVGKPIICNGANIGYRKAVFLQVSGYGGSVGSCDDETLMQRVARRNVGRVVFNADPDATAETSTPATASEFWRQRTRWASKRGHYEDKSLLVKLLMLYGFFLVLFLSTLVAIVQPGVRIPVLLVAVAKVVFDLTVLSDGARMFRTKVHLGHFLIAEIFHVPYIVVAALVGQINLMRWKERALVR